MFKCLGFHSFFLRSFYSMFYNATNTTSWSAYSRWAKVKIFPISFQFTNFYFVRWFKPYVSVKRKISSPNSSVKSFTVWFFCLRLWVFQTQSLTLWTTSFFDNFLYIIWAGWICVIYTNSYNLRVQHCADWTVNKSVNNLANKMSAPVYEISAGLLVKTD